MTTNEWNRIWAVYWSARAEFDPNAEDIALRFRGGRPMSAMSDHFKYDVRSKLRLMLHHPYVGGPYVREELERTHRKQRQEKRLSLVGIFIALALTVAIAWGLLSAVRRYWGTGTTAEVSVTYDIGNLTEALLVGVAALIASFTYARTAGPRPNGPDLPNDQPPTSPLTEGPEEGGSSGGPGPDSW